MRTIIILLTAFTLFATGCIRHSDEGLHRRERKTNAGQNVNLQKITPNLMVEDVERTVDFYKNVLGFYIVSAYPDTGKMDFAIVSLDSVDIMFQRKDNMIEELGQFQNTQIGGSFTIHIDVRDIIMIYEKAVLNARIVQELHQTAYGTKEFSIRDNNGYIITFSEPLRG